MGSLLAAQTGAHYPLISLIGLYLHIPFCHARCSYCDFATVAGQETSIDRYIGALIKDIYAQPPAPVDTIFMGGGTPSVLNADQIDPLFEAVARHFDLSTLEEATVEVNPESVERENMEAFKRHGINRISMGLQSTDNSTLKSLERLHTYDIFLDKFRLLRDLGFSNINVDLIYGLPGQSFSAWEKTLNDVLRLGVEHISAYALKVETGTALAKSGATVDDDLEADMYLYASNLLAQAGYSHYEISNFAKPGRECRHNLKYWKNNSYVGVGLSAASHVEGRRWSNIRGLVEYMAAIEAGVSPALQAAHLQGLECRKENVMLNLRLKKGVEAKSLETLGVGMFETFLHQGLAFVEEGMYRLTPKGWLLSNQLFQHLI